MSYRFNNKTILLGCMSGILLAFSVGIVLKNLYFSHNNNITSNSTDYDFIQYLDQRIKVLMEKYTIPGVNISLIRNGKILWAHAYGYADKEKALAMKLTTICRVESISKSVTAWGIVI